MTDGKANVLIVDDNEAQRIALAAVLADLEVGVIAAASGRQALRVLLQQEVAVILLDVNMPGLDGFETAALIRERRSSEHTPIIFITAYSDDARAARGYSLGAVDFILSPVQPNVLRSKVGVFIDLYRKTEQITRQREALRRYSEQLRQLSQASLAIHSAGSVDEVLRAVAQNASGIVGSRQASASAGLGDDGETVTIAALDTADGARVIRLARGTGPASGDDLEGPQRLTQRALEAGWAAARPPEIVPEVAMRGWLAAPLTARGGRCIGAVQLSDKRDGEFTAEDEGIVVQLAQMASVAIENIAAAEAREANRLKDEFLGVLSHELRTPLQAMLTWIAILRKEPLDPGMLSRGLTVLERSARSQVQLIGDLLDVSRIIRGQLRLESAPVDLVRVIGMALEALRPAAAAKQIELVWHPRADACWISGDVTRLQQVTWNLVSNAIKFTPANGRVVLDLAHDEQQAVMSVRDTGRGIPSEFLPHVFERFRQADSTTGRQHGGLGLGLAIVHHLIELHGGTVRAENAPQASGALFTVTLPRIGAPRPIAATARLSAPVHGRESANGLRLDGIRVVLAEDEADTRDALTTALQWYGAEVVAVSSAAAALQALRRETPDLLLSDIGMPGEDGLALIQQVRAAEATHGGRVPAVAITAYARAEDRAAALQAGFDAHVQKPIEPSDLARVVREHAKRA